MNSKRLRAFLIIPLICGAGRALAAEPPTGAPGTPSGFSRAQAISEASGSSSESDSGLDFTLDLSALYDSNVLQASGERMDPVESDFLLRPALKATYLGGNSSFEFGVVADLEYDYYFDRDDFRDPHYLLKVYGGYQSRKMEANFSSSYGFDSGVNRRTGEFLGQSTFANRFQGSYNLTARTSLLASLTQSSTDSDTSNYADTTSNTAEMSALWKVSALTEIGPGISYGTRSGADDAELVVVGPTLRLNYQLTQKVKFRSKLGLEFTDFPFSDDDDDLFNWFLALNYRASALWGLDLSMTRDTQAALSQEGGFDDVTYLRFSHWRKLRQARLVLGLEYELREKIGNRTATPSGDLNDYDYWEFFTTLALPVYKDEIDLELTLSYRNFDSGEDRDSWDGVQLGTGLSWEF